MFGFVDDVLGYRKPPSLTGGFSGSLGGAGAGSYQPEPELIIHTPGFKDAERSSKRVGWKKS